MATAQPLKVPSTSNGKVNGIASPDPSGDKPSGSSTPTGAEGAGGGGTGTVQGAQATGVVLDKAGMENITNPTELTAFVEKLLTQLETKFDEMSGQVLDRMTQMSARVDSLEASIQDLIHGDLGAAPAVPQSPGPKAELTRRTSGT